MLPNLRRLLAAAALAAPLSALAADGLSVSEAVWPTWQLRLSANLAAQPWAAAARADLYGRTNPAAVVGMTMLGDYFFAVPRLLPLSSEGGLRATSGVVSYGGLRPPPAAMAYGYAEAADPLPYLGLGYTHAALSGGWGFSADVGLVAQNPGGASQLSRSLLGAGPSLDDAVRSLKLAPMLQLGVRYTF